MVPADCSICKRRLMIWDVTPFWCRRPKGSGKISVCDSCLSGALEEAPNTELDFKRGDAVPKLLDEWAPGFTEPEEGSQNRFDKRKGEVPWLKHTFWWIVHNCVSHPLIGVLPFTPFFKFHDWTSLKMHGRK